MGGNPVPGYGVDEEYATAMGCDLATIQAEGEAYRKGSYASGGPG